MKRYKNNKRQRHSGMALLAVLFIVFAITVISMGILCRSDMALASGQNLCLRNQSDYLAWAGLEHARAVIQSYDSTLLDPNNPPSISKIQLFGDDPKFYYSKIYYTVEFKSRAPMASDPNKYSYEVSSEGYYNPDIINDPNNKQARSMLYADIVYDPNDGAAVFSSISRQ